LLVDQNTKVDKQLGLLSAQNAKIDQQTAVADAQKRGAYLTEMFSILEEVAKARTPGGVPEHLIMRIAILTSSAAPYVYLDFGGDQVGDEPRRIPRALSPERGQLVVAFARIGMPLQTLVKGGARFEQSDLRGADLKGADLSSVNWSGSDFSFATLDHTKLESADPTNVVIKKAVLLSVDFTRALLARTVIENSTFSDPQFDEASFIGVTIKGGRFHGGQFVEAIYEKLSFENVSLTGALPAGLPWSQEIQDSVARRGNRPAILSSTFARLATSPYDRRKPVPRN